MITAALILFILLSLALGSGCSWSDVTQTERNALVFADRNRDYGAYRLRTDYGNRVGVAMLCAIGLLGAAVVVPSAIARLGPHPINQATPPVVVVVDLGQVFTPPPIAPKPTMPHTAAAVPPVKQDPDVQHYVFAVDSLHEIPEPPLDTTTMAQITDPLKGSGTTGGLTAPDGFTGTGAGAGTDTGNGSTVLFGFEVQEVPQFPGGETAMAEWVRRNLDFPPDASGKDVVYVQFTVGLDGSVEDVQAVKGKQQAYKHAAERTVKRMPRWKPARMNGHDVRCRLTLPLRFETR